MRIAFITPEAQPFSKTGGLGDVAGALPWALAHLGADVTLISPYYAGVSRGTRALEVALKLRKPRRSIAYAGADHALGWRVGEHEGVRLVFCDHGAYFNRPGLYLGADGVDYPDNAERFSYFQRSALEWMLDSAWTPDVLHVHDWQAALVPLLLRTLYADTPPAGARTLLTIHNMGYQGVFPADWLADSGLGWEHFHIEGLEYHGKVSWLKGGIVYADRVNTVSPSYAREILTPEQGMGLDGVLSAHRDKLCGILNGIDAADWDPATDAALPAPFSKEKLRGKSVCKAALQDELGLAPSRKALLIGMIARFDRQKGVTLALDALPPLLGGKLQFVLLGSGDAALEEAALRLALEHPESAAVRVGFDAGLARRIYAGCDALLMPSLYEPCGLNQMYAQRYGAVPIVHATGGLRDTVRDATKKRLAKGRATGFAFAEFEARALRRGLKRALKLHGGDRRAWRKLMRACMKLDNSWEHSAKLYLQLMQELVGAWEGQVPLPADAKSQPEMVALPEQPDA
jgi:starch synthase